ncbi:MAG TPA: aminoglycoside adenylyltransferase domain-containing protein [Anaerolineales bacterium]|nr:aminoglycoside adenylyltransferase domain-containing protein [Anaerolineales bacterium]
MSQHLPGWLDAFYIVGSIALDEFNEQFSDIDFIAALNQKPTLKEIEELRRVHQAIEKNHPSWKMSGSYIQSSDLGKLDNEMEPHPHYHDGVLHPNDSYELNSVTWWELKQRGIAVLGEEPQNLPFTVDWDRLISSMKENMNSYWVSWMNRPVRLLSLYSDWGIQWAVLGILRQFYTFKENSITTKVRAGKHALDCLPVRWHKLIQEAIRIREGKKGSAYRSRIARMIEAVNFLKYVIQLCNASFSLK